MTNTNTLKNLRIEYHILQSFPVSCLNRDDVGSPKSAIVGGVERARVSSQCWKRQVRLELHDLGVKMGTRTRNLAKLMEQVCGQMAIDYSEKSVQDSLKKIQDELTKDTLLFIAEPEIKTLVEYAQGKNFNAKDITNKELAKLMKKLVNPAVDALDIALFGRMVAKAVDMNVEAAASFSHAISTHKVANELDFFTAVDDYPVNRESDKESKGETETGAAHMGILEFNSATYYRYISLDLAQLAQSLGVTDDDEEGKALLRNAIASFTVALFKAVPPARQNTQSGASPWDYARVLVRRGQRLQASFETPVKAEFKNGGGYSAGSISRLNDWIDRQQSMFGSLYCREGDYNWGVEKDYSIDNLISDLQQHVG